MAPWMAPSILVLAVVTAGAAPGSTGLPPPSIPTDPIAAIIDRLERQRVGANTPLLAQVNTANSASMFEAASVKPNTSGGERISMGSTPGGYTAVNVPLRLLVLSAYGLRPSQVVGGPGWMDVNRFDVVARAPEGAPRSAIMPMLRALLADRFKLAVRSEMREQSVYALVLSRADRRLGPQLRASTAQCAPGTPANPCRLSGTIGAVAGSVKATGQAMSDLATYLGDNSDRFVVDRTGLNGRFDFEMVWTADNFAAVPPGVAPAQNERAALFTTLQEQLGLKLESARGPVPFLIIEGADLPTPD